MCKECERKSVRVHAHVQTSNRSNIYAKRSSWKIYSIHDFGRVFAKHSLKYMICFRWFRPTHTHTLNE